MDDEVESLSLKILSLQAQLQDQKVFSFIIYVLNLNDPENGCTNRIGHL